jgi:hypothetical protein
MGKINIDLSKLTDGLKKMAFLRSFSMLLLPAAIIIAAGAVFTAALFMGSSFRNKVSKQSIPLGKEVDSRLGKVIPLEEVEAEKRYQQQYQQDANLIEKTAIETTQRELLSYEIFPEPNETSSMIFTRFGNKFCEQIKGRVRQLNAGDCPTEEELISRYARHRRGVFRYTRRQRT